MPRSPAGDVLATRTSPPPLAPLSPFACLVPPAQFGRRAQDTRDPHAEVLDGRSSGHSATGCQPRTLPILVDDPVATALSLRTHMEPADLLELTLILAEAAADVLRDRDTPEEAVS
jgi:hypothetical protein